MFLDHRQGVRPMTSEIIAIMQRLEKVERENSRLKRAAMAMLFIAACVLIMGQSASKKTLTAERFILIDGAGKHRAVLEVDQDEPRLVFNDLQEKTRLRLGLNVPSAGPEGGLLDELRKALAEDRRRNAVSGLVITDHEGNKVLTLGVYRGNPNLSMQLPSKQVAALWIGERGPTLKLNDGKRGIMATAWSAGGLSEGPAIRVMSGAPLFEPATVIEVGSIKLSDSDGFRTHVGVTALVVPQTGEKRVRPAASLVLIDKNEKVLWSAP